MGKENKNKKAADQDIPVQTSANWQLIITIAALVLITFFSFAPVINNSFINQDDNIYVFDNPSLSKPLPEAIVYFFGPHYFSGNYVPLTMTAYALAYHTAGVSPEFYHTLSLLIHILNVLLVFWFVYLLSNKKMLVAAFVALFFAIHPMRVESVAWVAELKDMLYAFFFISGLIVYVRYLQGHLSTTGTDATEKWKAFVRLLMVFVLFFLSILSKSAAAIFPVVLLSLDFYTARKPDKWLWIEKLPFLIVSVIFGIIAIKAQAADNLLNNHYPFVQKQLFASYAILAYLAKFLLPINLCNYYPYPALVDGHLPYAYYIAPVIVIVLLTAIYKTWRRSRLVAFGFLFFVANLVLVLQFVSIGNAIMAERYTYIPYIGLLFIIAMILDKIYYGSQQKKSFVKPIAIASVAILVVTCSVLTYGRCKVWENADTMATDMLDKLPDDPIALNNKGYILLKEQDFEGATLLFRRAIQLKPNYVQSDYVKAYINLANCYLATHNYNDAVKITDSALVYAPHDYGVLNKKGYLLYLSHDYAGAMKFYHAALSIKGDDIDVLMNISQCYFEQKDYDNWAKTLDIALAYHPDDYFVLNNKGYALLLKGNYKDAIPYFQACLERKPDFKVASENLANCYRALNIPTGGSPY